VRFGHERGPQAATPASARRSTERGAVMVEFAMVALFMLSILAAAFDFGMTWRVGLITNDAARAGARTGSALAQDPLADWYAISNARAALSSSKQLNNVLRVVIYRSDATDGNAPASCLSGTATTSECDVLTGAQFRAIAQADFNTTTGCMSTSKATVVNWCPNERDNVQLTAQYYGFYVQVSYSNMFKVRGSINVDRDAVMRLEPDTS
jgi:Flp pilus assembly protein TadG